MARLDKLGLQKLVENINKEINTKINSIKDTLANNVSYIEEITEWIFEDGLYKHTITHPLNTDRIEVTAIDTLTKERVLVGDQAIDKNTVVIKSDIEQNLTVMIINCESEIKALEIPLDDTSTSELTTWSSEKIQSELDKKSTDAKSTTFDNSINGMTSTTVQDAIEENNTSIKVIDAEFDKPVNTQYSTVNGIKEFECKDGYIDNIYIEGQTLVNLWTDTTYASDKTYSFTANGSTQLKSISSDMFKPSTVYTIYIEVIENTLNASLPCIINGSSYVINTPLASLDIGYTGVYKTTITTRNDLVSTHKVAIGITSSATSGTIKFKYAIVEGDHVDSSFSYFEGLKSIGQGDKIEVLTYGNHNVINTNSLVISSGTVSGSTGQEVTDVNRLRTDFINLNSNISNLYILTNKYKVGVRFFDVSKKIILSPNYVGFTETNSVLPIPKDAVYYRLIFANIDYNTSITSISSHFDILEISQYDKKQILTTLRSLSNGVKDEIVKQGDKYYKIKRCGEVVLNGNENWEDDTSYYNSTTIKPYVSSFISDAKIENDSMNINVYCDKFNSSNIIDVSNVSEGICYSKTKTIHIRILKTKATNASGFKTWLASNPVTVVYELATPVIEELPNFNPRCFDNKTTILLNSGVVQGETSFEVTNSMRSELEVLKSKVSDLNDYLDINSDDEEICYPTLLNGWVSQNGVSQLQLIKNGNIVFIKGAFSNGVTTTGTIIAKIPSHFCPQKTVVLSGLSGIPVFGTVPFVIDINGNIKIENATSSIYLSSSYSLIN